MKKRIKNIEEPKKRLLNLEWLILFGVFFVIALVFFLSLSIVKNNGNTSASTGDVVLSPKDVQDFSFGIGESLFSLAFGFLMASFLYWTKSVAMNNAYLGTIIGLIGAGLVGYGFSLRYRGPYSTGFMLFAGLFIVGYLGRNFWIYRKKEVDKDSEE